MAIDGNLIYVTDGVYQTRAESDEKAAAQRKKNPAFVLKHRVTIVGQSVNSTILRGSVNKWGEHTATFRRLKLQICSRDYAGLALDDEVYVMEGGLEFDGCAIESPVNTMFYVMRSVLFL